MLTITAYPRIHISLIGMNKNGYRVNGGLGFSISAPTLSVLFEESDPFEVIDGANGLSDIERRRLIKVISMVAQNKGFVRKYKAYVDRGSMYSHIGLGSNTALYMAFVEALFIFNTNSYTKEEIVRYSTRGGTSGIGINTYFKGGFVFDIGIPSICTSGFKPSSCYTSAHRTPSTLFESSLPAWELGICIPNVSYKTEEDEKLFFKNNCPIDKRYVEDILYESVYGITAAVIDNDFDTFCASIDAIQKTKWKELERGIYGEQIINTDTLLRNAGARCVGMSSLGPLLYFFGANIEQIVDIIHMTLPEAICCKTSFNNSGRTITKTDD